MAVCCSCCPLLSIDVGVVWRASVAVADVVIVVIANVVAFCLRLLLLRVGVVRCLVLCGVCRSLL